MTEVKRVGTTHEFDDLVEALSKPKRFPKLPSDLAEFKSRLAAGTVQSKRARGMDSAPVFGARVRDSTTGKGTRGGFRVLYFDGPDERTLLFIDRRRELDDWPADLILEVLERLGLWPPP